MAKNDRSLSNRNRSNLSDARGVPTNSLSLDAFYQKAKKTVNRFVLGLKPYFDFLVHGDVDVEGDVNTLGNYYESDVRVIESGSNSNGYWIKYVDGTLVQYGTQNFDSSTTAAGAIYRSALISVTLPTSFLNTLFTICVSSSASLWFGANTNGVSGLQFRMFYHTSLTGTRTALWSAIGRWK
jgi:hypothetical protein